MKRICILASLLAPLLAAAQDVDVSEPVITRGQGWSVLSGKTVGQGDNALVAEIGWPGLSLGALHGVTDKVDIGGKFSFNYGVQGVVTSLIQPGIAVQGVFRIQLYETSRFNVGLKLEPGPFFYFPPRNAPVLVGLNLPVGAAVGIPIGSALIVSAGLDFPMYATFGPYYGGFYFPILIGASVEYFIDSKLEVFLNLRMGPTLGPYVYAPFTLFPATIGIGYKL
jgi:hypothetical protein